MNAIAHVMSSASPQKCSNIGLKPISVVAVYCAVREPHSLPAICHASKVEPRCSAPFRARASSGKWAGSKPSQSGIARMAENKGAR